jgi:PAS domain S-box-containing protein
MPLLFAASDTDLIVGAITALTTVVGGFLEWVRRNISGKLEGVGEEVAAVKTDVAAVKTDVAAVKTDVTAVTDRVKKIEPAIEKVQKELVPNGGKSLRDAIDEIERRGIITDGLVRTRFEGDTLASYECNAKGKCTYASTALADLFGINPEDFLGNGWLSAVKGQDERMRVWQNWQQAVAEGVPYSDTYQVVLPHGETIRVRTYTRAVKDKKGEVVCYFGVVTPLPDSKTFTRIQSNPYPAPENKPATLPPQGEIS